MVDVIKRKTTGVSVDTGNLVKIDMVNISPASFSTALPATTAVTAGQTMTLTVVATGGSGTYTYQWFKNNNAIVGANAAVYTKASSATTDSGTYKVVVHDDNGNLISGSTVVTVS